MYQMVDFLQLGLDGAARRQKAIASNISNVDTPNYKRRDVDFAAALRQKMAVNNQKQELSLRKTNSMHRGETASGQGNNLQGVIDKTGVYRNDGNNVDIDIEMAEMAKNNIYYNTLSRRISDRFKQLNEVISRGGQS